MSGKDEGQLNIVLIPSGDRETRSFSVSYRALRAVGLVAALAADQRGGVRAWTGQNMLLNGQN